MSWSNVIVTFPTKISCNLRIHSVHFLYLYNYKCSSLHALYSGAAAYDVTLLASWTVHNETIPRFSSSNVKDSGNVAVTKLWRCHHTQRYMTTSIVCNKSFPANTRDVGTTSDIGRIQVATSATKIQRQADVETPTSKRRRLTTSYWRCMLVVVSHDTNTTSLWCQNHDIGSMSVSDGESTSETDRDCCISSYNWQYAKISPWIGLKKKSVNGD